MKKSKTTKETISQEKEDDALVFQTPNPERIPCLTCKHGLHNFLASYCLKYELKPNSVYFDNKPCEHYKPIDENK